MGEGSLERNQVTTLQEGPGRNVRAAHMGIAGLAVPRPVLDNTEDTGGLQAVVPGVHVDSDLPRIIGEAAVFGGDEVAGYSDVRVRSEVHTHTQSAHPKPVAAGRLGDPGRAPVTHRLSRRKGVDQ